MKLIELQEVIHSDLRLIIGDEIRDDVWCYGNVFEAFADNEVIGIRADKDYVVISLGEKHDR